MSGFQQIALLLIAAWFVLAVTRFRSSSAFLLGMTGPQELGLGGGQSWPLTAAYGLGGLAILLAYSPIADRVSAGLVREAPDLKAFRALQGSKKALVGGIAVAWIFGGFLEELIVRGIVLKSLAGWLGASLPAWLAAAVGVAAAAVGAGLAHSYQGRRAVLIIGQLSILLGALFVLSGYNLWVVILCHGLYDTIAFIRFARKQSLYSNLSQL